MFSTPSNGSPEQAQLLAQPKERIWEFWEQRQSHSSLIPDGPPTWGANYCLIHRVVERGGWNFKKIRRECDIIYELFENLS